MSSNITHHLPSSLYELSLNKYCEFLNQWSQLSSTTTSQSLLNNSNNKHSTAVLDYLFTHRNNNNDNNEHVALTRSSSIGDINLDIDNRDLNEDKIISLKTYHHIMGLFFCRKSFDSSIENRTNCNDENKENYDNNYECNEKIFKQSYYHINKNICEHIFNRYQELYNRINDRILLFPMFNGEINRLDQMKIIDGTLLTTDGLKILREHDLIRLKISNLVNCTLTELINNLSPWTVKNLKSFDISYCTFTRFNKICVILSLVRLTNLIHLDVSHTSFNNQCLEIIADHLINLRSLNLSSTKIFIIKPLLRLSKLERLNLHNVSLTCKDEFAISHMLQLKYLDISDERFSSGIERYIVCDHLNEFFHRFINFDRLIELDISGRRLSSALVFDLIEQRILKYNKDKSVMPLKFIGLLSTSEFEFTQIYNLYKRTNEKLMMTGSGVLIHVLQSLLRYRDRPTFILKALKCLCPYTYRSNILDYQQQQQLQQQQQKQQESMPLEQEIDLSELMNYDDDDGDNENYVYDNTIDDSTILIPENLVQIEELQKYRASLIAIMIDIMKKHMKNKELILFTSGNLYNLTKYSPNLPSYIYRNIINICIEIMKNYSKEYYIIKNILFTICTERILQDITFDRNTCIRLVMDTLFTFNDISINRLALGICTILAAKIPTVENVLIGEQSIYLKRLLQLVYECYCVNTPNNEIILRLTLSALWNFTDEAPKTCETFIYLNGIQLYVDTLILFHDRSNIETKILGLLNNIAEVYYLRSHLLQPTLLNQLRKLIYSHHIDVSYFAIGILAQLASDNQLDWNKNGIIEDFDLNEILQEMSKQIQSWPNPSVELVAYRSFEPFMPLLTNDRHESILLWALWAIHHVCTKNPNKYCRMLYDEKCLVKIVNILFERLQKQYDVSNDQKIITKRLINLATIADDEFKKLCKANTEWNCYDKHKWDIVVVNDDNEKLFKCEKTSPMMMMMNDDNNNSIDDKQTLANIAIKHEECDCLLKFLLDNDPLIRLTSIILKTYHCFSPIPLHL